MAVIGPRKITRKSAAVGALIIAPALGMLGLSILPIAAVLGNEPEKKRAKTKAQGKKKAIRKTRI